MALVFVNLGVEWVKTAGVNARLGFLVTRYGLAKLYKREPLVSERSPSFVNIAPDHEGRIYLVFAFRRPVGL